MAALLAAQHSSIRECDSFATPVLPRLDLGEGLPKNRMFGIATSRFDGYQLLFFIVQIPAVIASRHLRRFAAKVGLPAIVLLRGITIIWMMGTSILFFHGVNRIVPFYTATPWLP